MNNINNNNNNNNNSSSSSSGYTKRNRLPQNTTKTVNNNTQNDYDAPQNAPQNAPQKQKPAPGVISRGFGAEYPEGYDPNNQPEPRKTNKYESDRDSKDNRDSRGNVNGGNGGNGGNGVGVNGGKKENKIPPRKSSLRIDPSEGDEYAPPSSSSSRVPQNVPQNVPRNNQNNNGGGNVRNNSNDNNDNYNSMNSNPYPDPSPDLYTDESLGQLMECDNCGRKFNPKPYEKHVMICAKVNAKRKTFESAKMRAEGRW